MVFLAVLVAGAGWLAAASPGLFAREVRTASDATAKSAGFFVETLDRSLRIVDRATLVVREAFPQLPSEDGARSTEARLLLTAAAAGVPHMRVLVLFDDDGRVLAHSDFEGEVDSLLVMPWRAHRFDPSLQPRLAGTRPDRPGGMLWSRRIDDASGSFAAVVVAEMVPDNLVTLDRSVRERHSDRLTLFHRNETSVLYATDDKPADPPPALAGLIARGSYQGTIDELNDPAHRIVSYRISAQVPLAVTVERSRRTIENAWIGALFLRFLAVVAMAFLLAGGVWAHLRRRRRTSADLPARPHDDGGAPLPVFVTDGLEKLHARIGATETCKLLDLTTAHLIAARGRLETARGAQLQRLCHDVASVAGTAGLQKLAGAARAVERAWREGNPSIDDMAPSVAAAIEEALPVLARAHENLRAPSGPEL